MKKSLSVLTTSKLANQCGPKVCHFESKERFSLTYAEDEARPRTILREGFHGKVVSKAF
jgi:hypothetical protein